MYLLSENKKVIRQLNLMVILTLITQVFILIKNAIVAAYFGVGIELDSFNLANRVSTFVYSFIGAGVSTVIIPYLKDKANRKSVEIFISITYSISFLLLILMLILKDPIILFTSGSNNNYFIDISTNIFMFTIITGFFNSLIQLIKALLEFNGFFNIQKLIVLITTILSVVLLIIAGANIYYYAIILLILAVLGTIIHIYYLKKVDFSFNFNFNYRNNGFKEMMRLLLPTILSTGVYQISLLIDTMIAARLDVGSISILSYSSSIISMVNMLLLTNLTSFFYPRLVKIDSILERQVKLSNYILLINAIMLVIFIMFYSVGQDGISILFERGKFSSDNTNLVYLCSLILAISLPSNAVRDLMYRYFYMNKDTFTPFVNSIVISMNNIVISLILSYYIGIFGVVLGTVISSYLSLIFIVTRFTKKFKILFDKKEFVKENLKIIIVSITTLLVLLVFKSILVIDNSIIAILVYITLIILIFITLLKLTKSKLFNINL